LPVKTDISLASKD